MPYKAVNWNRLDDETMLAFWNQNLKQFWIDTEIPISDDRMAWVNLTQPEREVYKRVLGGLTLLDTIQGQSGVLKLLEHVEGLHDKAVLSNMLFMENIHAKSYSTIFTTIASSEESDEIFEWVQTNKYLQRKAEVVSSYYNSIDDNFSLYMAMVASVFLESFLFYSGFYYPLFLAGQGKMTASGEIINLIIRDESIHGVIIGYMAQKLKLSLSPQQQVRADTAMYNMLDNLYKNEVGYTDELYSPIGLAEDVKSFVRYNSNKALSNLGYEGHFPEENVSPIVINGLRTETKNHDFFSVKGNGYVKALNVEALTDEDFKF